MDKKPTKGVPAAAGADEDETLEALLDRFAGADPTGPAALSRLEKKFSAAADRDPFWVEAVEPVEVKELWACAWRAIHHGQPVPPYCSILLSRVMWAIQSRGDHAEFVKMVRGRGPGGTKGERSKNPLRSVRARGLALMPVTQEDRIDPSQPGAKPLSPQEALARKSHVSVRTLQRRKAAAKKATKN